MNIVKTIGTGIAWNTTGTIAGKIIMFVNIFLTLNFLTIYEYGFSELVFSVIAMTGIALLPGLSSAVIADLGVERGRGDKAMMSTIFHQYALLLIFLAGCAWAVLFFGALPLARMVGNEYAAQFLQIASFTFLISPFRTLTQTLSTVMLRYFDLSFYSVIEEVFKCLLLLVFIVYLGQGIRGLMYAMVLSQLFGLLVFLPRLFSGYRYFALAPTSGKIRFWRLLRGHRAWSVGTSYVGTISQNVRIWIVKLLLGTEAVGIMAFAYGLLSHIVSLMPLATVIAPVVVRYVDKKDQLVRILRASIKLQLLLAIGLFTGGLMFSYLFVTLLFPKYVVAVPLVYILLCILISNSVASLFTPVFAAYKEQVSLFQSNSIKLLLGLTALPVFIMLFGISGVAIELVFTTYVIAVERYVRLRRILPTFSLPMRDLISPDGYERDAMHTVRMAVVSRFPVLKKFM